MSKALAAGVLMVLIFSTFAFADWQPNHQEQELIVSQCKERLASYTSSTVSIIDASFNVPPDSIDPTAIVDVKIVANSDDKKLHKKNCLCYASLKNEGPLVRCGCDD